MIRPSSSGRPLLRKLDRIDPSYKTIGLAAGVH
jgi:hypothetical protein